MSRYLAVHRVARIFPSQDAWLKDWAALRRRAKDRPGAPQWLLSF